MGGASADRRENMRILHTSDLHLGKRIHETPLGDDQRHMLDEIVRIASEERPDALVIAGDVFDRAVPSEEAVTLFGDFLDRVSGIVPDVLVIAGNHDSGARLGYCDGLLERSGVHIAGRFGGGMERVPVGDADFWLLPFFRVSEVRAIADAPVDTYADAMAWILDRAEIDASRMNVLVAHQFFIGRTPPETSDSEDQVPDVGGLSYIPADMLGAFDYVALGHLHLPQGVGRDTVRYSGSPLKYSASEARTDKGITIVDMGDDGISVRTVPVEPLHDMRVLKGTLREIVDAAPREGPEREDYVYIRLTDRPAGVEELRRAYPNILEISYEMLVEADPREDAPGEALARESAETLFSRFYEEMTGTELTPYQRELLAGCAELVGRNAE